MNVMETYQYTYLKFFKEILSGSRIKLLILIFFQLISGVCPLLTAYYMSQLIDNISIMRNTNISMQSFGVDQATVLIVACTLFLLLEETFTVTHNFFCDYFEDSLCHKVKFLLLKKISLYPTNEFFENPKISNLIALSQQNIQEFGRHVNNYSYFFKGLFSLTPALIAVFNLKWWIPLVIIVTLAPLMYSRVKLQRHTMNARTNFSSLFKTMDIYEECLTSGSYSKEIRLYKMQPSLLKIWNDFFIKYLYNINSVRKSGVFTTLLLSLISGGGLVICFFYVVRNALLGNFSLGNLSFLFIIILQLRVSISNVIFSGSEVLKANLSISPLLNILNIKEPQLLEKQGASTHTKTLLSLQNVTFSYPGNESLIVDNISLSLKAGETIAIVGENGAGKSTLIKLICRFYEPSKGKILWEEADIKTIGFDEYRSKISALFQDFAKFPLSVRENIDISKKGIKNEKILAILDKVNLNGILESKLESILSKSSEDGIDLSGGQWQRLGLARILADLESNSFLELLVFDEPTSALDPHSEHQVIELIREIMKQKTSIIISHRLALTRFVDRILVMENGRIVEDGSHSNLMQFKGKYYEMFTKQASYYTD